MSLVVSSSPSSSLSHLAVSLWAWHRAENRLSRSKVMERVKVVWVPTEKKKEYEIGMERESEWKRGLTICSFAISDSRFHQTLLNN